ncbi:MAG TPA: type I 3-dehydroquinate dehydratase [Blastocatellia bacterium]
MAKTTLIATITRPPSAEEILTLPQSVGFIQVRADIAGDLNPMWLRNHFPGRLIYSLTSLSQGGLFDGPDQQRAIRLGAAAREYDLVELEARDLSGALLDLIPGSKRIVSTHSDAQDAFSMAAEFSRLSSVPAQLYKLTSTATRPAETVAPLSFLNSIGRTDVAAFCTGDLGFWTRLIAPLFGAPLAFGLIDKHPPTADVEPGITQLVDDYGVPDLQPMPRIYGIAGNPVRHSLSPRLHNAAYRAAGYAALFVPFQINTFDEFWKDIVEGDAFQSLGLSIDGLTVASPYKEAVADRASIVSRMVRRACSSNVMARSAKGWIAETTDPEGVMLALADREIDVRGKPAAVVGCGGAGRAVALALDMAGADVTLVNRSHDRGSWASDLLGLPFIHLSEFTPRDFSVVVNATPVGRVDHQAPFAIEDTHQDAVIVDLVYASEPTPLVAGALDLGREVIDGREVLLIQVRRQYKLMTGLDMPLDLARDVLGYGSEVACLAARP